MSAKNFDNVFPSSITHIGVCRFIKIQSNSIIYMTRNTYYSYKLTFIANVNFECLWWCIQVRYKHFVLSTSAHFKNCVVTFVPYFNSVPYLPFFPYLNSNNTAAIVRSPQVYKSFIFLFIFYSHKLSHQYLSFYMVSLNSICQ